MLEREGWQGPSPKASKYKLICAGRHEFELLQVSGVVDDMAVDVSHKQWLGMFRVDIGRSFFPGEWCSTGTGYLERSGTL